MCGIYGNFGFIEKEVFTQHKNKISKHLSRRGPDQLNKIDLKYFLAVHSRLIIQGSSEDGIQPMIYKNIIILFNGNLYNKSSLREELKLIGYEFDGLSDTEVVIKSIYHWGDIAFKKFNGFFSIVIFDKDSRNLKLVRDRLGQKPLYYSLNSKSVFFGSTEFFIPREFHGKLRKESIIDFITYGFVPSPFTMFENLFCVDPGNIIEFDYLDEKIIKKNLYNIGNQK